MHLGFDVRSKPYALASTETNLKQLSKPNPEALMKVREILLGISPGCYKRLEASGKVYPKKSEYKEFTTEASLETLAKVISRLAVLAQTKHCLSGKSA